MLLKSPTSSLKILPPAASQNNDPLNILLVEDAKSDLVLTQIALTRTRIPYKLWLLSKGDEVTPALAQRENNDPDNLPDLIILDLGLPGANGFQILAELTNMSEQIRAIPIIVLTGRAHFKEICESYHLNIAAYMQKPCNFEHLRETLTEISCQPQSTASDQSLLTVQSRQTALHHA